MEIDDILIENRSTSSTLLKDLALLERRLKALERDSKKALEMDKSLKLEVTDPSIVDELTSLTLEINGVSGGSFTYLEDFVRGFRQMQKLVPKMYKQVVMYERLRAKVEKLGDPLKLDFAKENHEDSIDILKGGIRAIRTDTAIILRNSQKGRLSAKGLIYKGRKNRTTKQVLLDIQADMISVINRI